MNQTATEAGQSPDLYRERLEAERDAQRQHVRLEILRMIVGSNMRAAMTPAELVTAAETVEAFVLGKGAESAPAGLTEADRSDARAALLEAFRRSCYGEGQVQCLLNDLKAIKAAP